jgi:hypothetical protein
VALIHDHLCDGLNMTFDVCGNELYCRLGSPHLSKFCEFSIKGQHVANSIDNSVRWLLIDHGLQRSGGVSSVGGADAPLNELRYFLTHSDSAVCLVLQGPKLFSKLLSNATVKHPAVMEYTTIYVGLTNDKYGPVKTIILMYREKCSQQDLDVMMEEPLGGSNLQVYFRDDLPMQQQQLLEHNQGKPTIFPMWY